MWRFLPGKRIYWSAAIFPGWLLEAPNIPLVASMVKNICRFSSVAAFGLIPVLMIGPGVYAETPDSASPQVQTLPTSQSLADVPAVLGRDYRLRTFKAKNASGEVMGVPAHLLSIASAAGGWMSPDPSIVPHVTSTIPRRFRDKVQLFYSEITGWIMVPRGWQVWDAENGADGSLRLEFAQPSSSHTNWIEIGSEGGCYGCMLDDAAGFVPRATLVKAGYQRGLGYTSPNVALDPKPSTLIHPDPCSALLTYSSGGAVVHGVVLLLTYDGDPAGFEDLYIALPPNEAKLGRFISKAFLTTQRKRSTDDCGMALKH